MQILTCQTSIAQLLTVLQLIYDTIDKALHKMDGSLAFSLHVCIFKEQKEAMP